MNFIGASFASRLSALDALPREQQQTNEVHQTQFEKLTAGLDAAAKEIETRDRLGNFEIQRLMSAYNQAETLSSNVQKKQDDANSGVINKIG